MKRDRPVVPRSRSLLRGCCSLCTCSLAVLRANRVVLSVLSCTLPLVRSFSQTYVIIALSVFIGSLSCRSSTFLRFGQVSNQRRSCHHSRVLHTISNLPRLHRLFVKQLQLQPTNFTIIIHLSAKYSCVLQSFTQYDLFVTSRSCVVMVDNF